MMSGLSKKCILCWGSATIIFWAHCVPAAASYGSTKPGSQQVSLDRDKNNKGKHRHEIPLLQALKELNRKRGVYFLYTDKTIGERMVADIAHPKADLEKILDELLAGSGLHFTKVNDKTFVILNGEVKKRGADTALAVAEEAGTRIVADSVYHVVVSDVTKGMVTNTNGQPLSGVSVTVRGSGKGTVTDAAGAFTVEANRDNILQFSSVGYRTKEFSVPGEGESIKVSLQVSETEMTEVVMTALGIKKQVRSLGYATTEVSGSEFTSSRETNFGNALSGKIAGVSVSGVATGPYGSSRVVIRGNASLTANNQPLFVVDGVPYDNTNQGGFPGQYGGQDFGDGLSNISPDDIESVQVLKGVAAAALYGYRGGNGAILITTKSGPKAKGIDVEFNNNLTFNSVSDNRDYQYTYGQGMWGAKPLSAGAAMASPYYSWGAKIDGSQAVNFLGQSFPYLPFKDDFRDFYSTGVANQSSVALEGANAKGHFRLGLSDLYLNPVIPNSNMQQQGLNLNIGYAVSKRLQLNLTADYVGEQVRNRASFSDAPGNAIASTLFLANTFDIRWLRPLVNAGGMELLPGNDIYFDNPYFVADNFRNSTARNRLTGGITLKYNLLDWLFVQGGLSRDGYVFDATVITPTGTGYRPGGDYSQYELTYHELNSNFMIGVDKQWNKSLSFSAHVGGNSQDNVTQDYGVGDMPTLVEGIAPQRPIGPFVIPYLYTADNIATKPFQRAYAHYRVNSLYASVDLSYKNLLYLNLTGRNDWFSTLSINSDSYLYPSVSGSFVFSDAWKMPSWITYGKVRLSFAQASNGTTPYQNMLTYGTQGYTISGQLIGFLPQSNIPNPRLKPVSIHEDEVGLNMQFLSGLLGLDVALYDKITQDDILPVTVSPTSGFNGDNLNIGKVRNKGIEWLVTAKVLQTHSFSWNLSWNMAENISKVLYLGPGVQSVIVSGALARWGGEVNISNVVGLPYAQIMGFAYKKDARGNVVFGPNGEPEQTGVVPLGSGMYKVTGGLNNEFHYKRYTLSFLLDGKFGAKLYSQTNLLLYYYGLQKNTLQGRESGFIGKGVNDHGQPNMVAVPSQIYFQDISAAGTDHIAQEFVYDASFIKLRSLSLEYTFSSKLWKKSPFKEFSVAVVGRNLATLLKHTPNIDPESNLNATNGQGLELSGYPAVRSLGFNINVKF
jgi:TonB-linked SusC/RagA family outer membrane protein